MKTVFRFQTGEHISLPSVITVKPVEIIHYEHLSFGKITVRLFGVKDELEIKIFETWTWVEKIHERAEKIDKEIKSLYEQFIKAWDEVAK